MIVVLLRCIILAIHLSRRGMFALHVHPSSFSGELLIGAVNHTAHRSKLDNKPIMDLSELKELELGLADGDELWG